MTVEHITSSVNIQCHVRGPGIHNGVSPSELHTGRTALGMFVYACLQPRIINPAEQAQLKMVLEQVHLK